MRKKDYNKKSVLSTAFVRSILLLPVTLFMVTGYEFPEFERLRDDNTV